MHLDVGRAEVWHADLAGFSGRLAEFRGILGAEEILRADRFRFETDRVRFILSHGLLRTLLAEYIGAAREKIVFVYSAYGKPRVEPDGGGVAFNMSHSGERAVFAFARAEYCGVDIEQVREIGDSREIVERFFSRGEIAAFGALPDGERAAGFFRAWTRKEAFIKALGEGLSFPLKDFEVSLKPGEAAALLSVRSGVSPAGEWTIRDVSLEPGYIAALALAGRNWEVRSGAWTDAFS